VPLEPGAPIFRGVDNRDRVAEDRLTAHSVSRIVKRLMRDLAHSRGKSDVEAKELVRLFSGHSLRAGYATSPAAADVPALRIQQHTRHKSADLLVKYVRESDKWSKSGLQGVLRRIPEAQAKISTKVPSALAAYRR
jgi:hypothetical protein